MRKHGGRTCGGSAVSPSDNAKRSTTPACSASTTSCWPTPTQLVCGHATPPVLQVRRTCSSQLFDFYVPLVRPDLGPRQLRVDSDLADGWTRRGYFNLALGIGIAQGLVTLGRIGFEGRFDYAAVGGVTNWPRLRGEAGPWQVLASRRVFYAAEPVPIGSEVGALALKGFSRSIRVFDVSGVSSATAQSGESG